jgi:hypothetical protein
MSTNPRNHKRIHRHVSIVIVGLILTACSSRLVNLPSSDIPITATFPSITETATPRTEQTAIAPQPSPLFNLPDNLEKISTDNIHKITELANVFPYFPPYFQFSEDGSHVAIGDMQKVEIRDTATGKIVSSIPAALPECDFGFGRYFRMNANGTFIALVSGQSIEVWQVGGGKVYEAPLFTGYSSNAPTCGADIPEMALSPDGRLLAESGILYSESSVKRFFRVIDIMKDSVLYEWNGNKDALHGALYTYYGLGFSDDGKLLQTFDAARFILSEGNLNQAFRFWSVGDWQEVEGDSAAVEQSFTSGQLLFPLSNSGVIEIRNKISNEVLYTISLDGCQWDSPCETRFSPDGSHAAVLSHAGEKIQYRNDSLHLAISIWDLTNGQEISNETGLFRNLEGVVIKSDGSVINASKMISGVEGQEAWWTFKQYFEGLQADSVGNIVFVPLEANSPESGDCQFCAICSVNTSKGEISCSRGLNNLGGEEIFAKKEGGQFFLVKQNAAGESIIGELALPKKIDLARTRIRLLGYSSQQQMLFYCVDESFRQAGCFIYDTDKKKALSEIADISFLRLSPDGSKAAFINRSVNALFTYDLSLKALARKSAFQSRAFPVNPVFSSDSKNLFYVIQSLNTADDLSVESLDTATGKITGRVSLKKSGLTLPTVFSIAHDNSYWAFAEKGGKIAVLSSEKGLLLYRWQAQTDEIIGLAISADQKWILTMGENNILKFMGVE